MPIFQVQPVSYQHSESPHAEVESVASDTSTATLNVDQVSDAGNGNPETSRNVTTIVDLVNGFPSSYSYDESAPYYKKKDDWTVILNPEIPKVLEVDAVSKLDHSSVVCCARFSSDGKQFATGSNNEIRIYNTSTIEYFTLIFDEDHNNDFGLYVRCVCFSPDGRYLAAGSENKLIHIWDISTRTVMYTLVGHDQCVYGVDYSLDGKLLVSGAEDGTVRVWDKDYQCKCIFATNESGPDETTGVTSVTFSHDGRYIAASSTDELVRIWDVKEGQLLTNLEGHADSVYSVAFSPDGKTLFSAALDNTVNFWDLGSIVGGTHLGNDVAPIRRTVFTGHMEFALTVACSPCGKWVASGSKDGSVYILDRNTAQPQLKINGHRNSVIAIAFNPIGGHFVTAGGDYLARLWCYKERL